MDDLQRLKILLYQYILFKGDYYKDQAQEAHNKLRSSKLISSDEFFSCYDALLKFEIFDDLQRDIANILGSFR